MRRSDEEHDSMCNRARSAEELYLDGSNNVCFKGSGGTSKAGQKTADEHLPLDVVRYEIEHPTGMSNNSAVGLSH